MDGFSAECILHLSNELQLIKREIIKQNIILALLSIVVLLVFNFWGRLTLSAGVFGHEGATLLVTLNRLRLVK